MDYTEEELLELIERHDSNEDFYRGKLAELREEPPMTTELQQVQRAAARVLEESKAAFERGELSDAMALGIRLVTVAHMMKLEHQPGALKIAREYAEALGMNFEVLDEQVQARIYEQVQIDQLDEGAPDDHQ